MELNFKEVIQFGINISVVVEIGYLTGYYPYPVGRLQIVKSYI